jgi:citrate/tricarballylate utilization protein|tara:strand:+ start:278 stop:1357 length:1080 start_codon:yes stop_codon:yes gene_type:complete
MQEAERLMRICNACRYCEAVCPVFPALERRRIFPRADLVFLANLCHECGACYTACQFSPPHEFDVNLPRVLAEVRSESYGDSVWPRAMSGLLARNGVWISVVLALSVAGFIAGMVGVRTPGALLEARVGPGAFYELMPHAIMVSLFGAAFSFAMTALYMSAREFRRAMQLPASTSAASWRQAVKLAASLHHLESGDGSCVNTEDGPDRRRLFHHMTAYGLLLCLASTVVATIYHYVLGREAPYPLFDLPVVLGTVGGIGMLFGSLGLFIARLTRVAMLRSTANAGIEVAFLVMLFLTSLSGLMLLALREAPVMGVLLALHLGVVFALFATLPYSKMVHGLYRLLALVRHTEESGTPDGA